MNTIPTKQITNFFESAFVIFFSWLFCGLIAGEGLYKLFKYSIAANHGGCIFIGFFLSTSLLVIYLVIKSVIFIIKKIKQK